MATAQQVKCILSMSLYSVQGAFDLCLLFLAVEGHFALFFMAGLSL